jgi:16S rRNA (guanine(1405)-N(7))-methyltransferase
MCEVSANQLDELVTAVRGSAKYRSVSVDLIKSIGSRELAHRRGLREAVKATKNKLHQIGGAYLERQPGYARWLDLLRQAAATGEPDTLAAACRKIMRHHASTNERLPILGDLFRATLAPIAPISSVLDVACGLNPLASPWMPLAPDAAYFACDIFEDMIAFLNDYFALTRLQGTATTCNVLSVVPDVRVDVAFVLKLLPCLDLLDPTAGLRLLDGLNARHLLVSFPVHSLGGRQKGMRATYEQQFRALIEERSWPTRRFEFATELAFLVTKDSS